MTSAYDSVVGMIQYLLDSGSSHDEIQAAARSLTDQEGQEIHSREKTLVVLDACAADSSKACGNLVSAIGVLSATLRAIDWDSKPSSPFEKQAEIDILQANVGDIGKAREFLDKIRGEDFIKFTENTTVPDGFLHFLKNDWAMAVKAWVENGADIQLELPEKAATGSLTFYKQIAKFWQAYTDSLKTLLKRD
ncbi:unnamed protein product [Cyclocybe aegerita]|uniref:Uncharacterized protein n=1 Tax=Cyclocybe aegerita TaxID=1973307 RepID=A0A8S0WQ99_CYCAE|nr:unnamed protein product [Cyclocybe aegerita]